MIVRRLLIAVPLVLVLMPAVEAAQLQLARVEGIVFDSHGTAAANATVQLDDALGGTIRSHATDSAGRFAFADVAPGRYTLRAIINGAEPLLFPMSINGALPVEVTLRFPPRFSGTVVVEAPLTHDAVSSRSSIAGASIEALPVRVRSQGLQELVATLPGWATEDNGLLHARGIDDGFLYVVDGVPVYERLDRLSGVGSDLTAVESVNVITGYVPAEFGLKAGGVIDVRTRSGLSNWATSVEFDVGSDQTTGASATAGGALGPKASLRLGGASQRSERFLDPVHPDNLHNHGWSANTFGQIGYGGDADRVSASWSMARADYDVPNTADQEVAGQNQRQAIAQVFGHLSWQRAWSGRVVSQASFYARRSGAELAGSARDIPLFAEADRSLVRLGGIASVAMQRANHLLKLGAEAQTIRLEEAFAFYVTDEDAAQEAGFSDSVGQIDRRDPFEFTGEATPRLLSMFVQDEWQASSRLTVSAGLRFDHSTMLLRRHQWSPRLGAAYRLGGTTVVRGSASRFFQPPQPENLLLSSSRAARVLSPFAEGSAGGGAGVEPERQWGLEAGIEQWLGRRLRVDAAYWHRILEQVADPNVFAGTTIIFPNAVASGSARGVDVRLEVPKQRGWSGYANLALGRVVQRGPITGGLFLEDEIGEIGDGEEFVPDHDQRCVLGGGVTWTHQASSMTVSLSARYETGTPIQREEAEEEELADRPGAELVDFDRDRVKPRTLVSLLADVPLWRAGTRSIHVRASLLNVFDKSYAYNFGNPFSGTHFGAPRTIAVTVRAEF